MNPLQAVDEMTFRRQLVISFLKEYAGDHGKRYLALDIPCAAISSVSI
jgi:hypothetical protein